jgi:hypothetical protein
VLTKEDIEKMDLPPEGDIRTIHIWDMYICSVLPTQCYRESSPVDSELC